MHVVSTHGRRRLGVSRSTRPASLQPRSSSASAAGPRQRGTQGAEPHHRGHPARQPDHPVQHPAQRVALHRARGRREPRDALFGIVLVTNAAIGIVQELRAKRTLDHLELLTAPGPCVRSGGAQQDITVDRSCSTTSSALRPGDQLPVDGVVVDAPGSRSTNRSSPARPTPCTRSRATSACPAASSPQAAARYRATRVGADAYAVKLAQEAKRVHSGALRAARRRRLDHRRRQLGSRPGHRAARLEPDAGR